MAAQGESSGRELAPGERTGPRGEDQDQDWDMAGTSPEWVLGWGDPPQLRAGAVSGKEKGEKYVPYNLQGFGVKLPERQQSSPGASKAPPGASRYPQRPAEIPKDHQNSPSITETLRGTAELPEGHQSVRWVQGCPGLCR